MFIKLAEIALSSLTTHCDMKAKLMSNDMSLACYFYAKRNPDVPPAKYAELEQILTLLGALDDNPTQLPKPRFSFQTSAPNLIIVEDESDLAEVITSILISAGYPENAIHVFSSGETAIAFAESNAISIAFVDIKLTDSGVFRRSYISGLNVLKAIKQQSPGAKVILISGFGTAQMAQDALLNSGASYYLGKPFGATEVLQIVNWSVAQLLGVDLAQMVMNEDASPPEVAGSESVLIVDDDVALAEGLALAVRSFGYRTTVAHNGSEALVKMNAEVFDAILLDIKMPGINGLEVLRNMPPSSESVVVMLTAVDDEAVAQQATDLGAASFLTKPCDLSLLQLTLEFAWAQR